MKPLAELLRFYPGLSYDRAARLADAEILCLRMHKSRLEAKEGLRWIQILGLSMRTKEGDDTAREVMVNMAQQAYPDDPDMLARTIIAITSRR